ncbi:MAG: hypothetical protein PHW13_01020 [Methylococcales bacterium]|nr:hypothetical protein [Methylococcales bacterium]
MNTLDEKIRLLTENNRLLVQEIESKLFAEGGDIQQLAEVRTVLTELTRRLADAGGQVAEQMEQGLKNIAAVAESGAAEQPAVFDSKWYLEQNPDVRMKGLDPYLHYMNHGRYEGRHPAFDRDWYLLNYPDVAQTGLEPLEHYLRYGKAEGRHPAFDRDWYLVTYTDVEKTGMEPLQHYLAYGKAEGRQPAVIRDWSQAGDVGSGQNLIAETANAATPENRSFGSDQQTAAFQAVPDCRLRIRQLANAGQAEFAECLELVNKSDQFNTTGEKWQADEFAGFINEAQGQVYSFSISDRFVNYGLVGVAITKNNCIRQLAMSRRVLGMDVEIAVIREICELLRSNSNSGLISARLLETDDSAGCGQVYIRAGFVTESSDHTVFILGGMRWPAEAAHVQTEEIQVSGANFNFDKWYYNRYEDVAMAYTFGRMPSAERHYETHGKEEARFRPIIF